MLVVDFTRQLEGRESERERARVGAEELSAAVGRNGVRGDLSMSIFYRPPLSCARGRRSGKPAMPRLNRHLAEACVVSQKMTFLAKFSKLNTSRSKIEKERNKKLD